MSFYHWLGADAERAYTNYSPWDFGDPRCGYIPETTAEQRPAWDKMRSGPTVVVVDGKQYWATPISA